MSRVSRRAMVVVAGACVALAVAACGSEPDPPETDPDPTATSSEAPEPTSEPADGNLAGGAETGFTIALPDGWVQFDPTSEELQAELEQAEVPSDIPIEEMAGQFAQIPGSFIAVDVPSIAESEGQFATNVNGFCAASGGVTDLDTLGQTAQAQLEGLGAADLASSEVTIGDVDAVRITYSLPQGELLLPAVQFVFFSNDERGCPLTFTTNEGGDPSQFDEVAGTVQLA